MNTRSLEYKLKNQIVIICDAFNLQQKHSKYNITRKLQDDLYINIVDLFELIKDSINTSIDYCTFENWITSKGDNRTETSFYFCINELKLSFYYDGYFIQCNLCE